MPNVRELRGRISHIRGVVKIYNVGEIKFCQNSFYIREEVVCNAAVIVNLENWLNVGRFLEKVSLYNIIMAENYMPSGVLRFRL